MTTAIVLYDPKGYRVRMALDGYVRATRIYIAFAESCRRATLAFDAFGQAVERAGGLGRGWYRDSENPHGRRVKAGR